VYINDESDFVLLLPKKGGGELKFEACLYPLDVHMMLSRFCPKLLTVNIFPQN